MADWHPPQAGQTRPGWHPSPPQQPAWPPQQPGWPPQQGVPGQQPPPEMQQVVKDLADGEWHRMHPLTPLLRGGIAFIVLVGILFTWWRDRIVGLFMPDEYNYYDDEGDPISWLLDSGYWWLALAGFTVIVLLAVAGFYFSWRKRTFRITADMVELREGILSRKHRRAPLARIQGIEVQKPFLARMVGCAKLDIEQAGSDGKVELAFISAKVANPLRAEILRRASGRREDEQTPAPSGAHAAAGGITGHVGAAAQDIWRPDADLQQVEHTLFKLSTGRLIGSSVLSVVGWIIFGVVVVAAVVMPAAMLNDDDLMGLLVVFLSFFPAVLAGAIGVFSRVMSLVRFRVAKTQDGIRLTRGLASVTSQTVPPGRVFSLTISQPLFWRPFGWWTIRYGRATPPSSSSSSSNQQQLGTTLLPVGNREDLLRVLSLVLSEADARYVVDVGLYGKGVAGDGFVVSPPRARAFRWFSRRRNGIHGRDTMFVLRKGAIWRSADVLPAARVQSVGMTQGPIYGMAGLARLQFHTVGVLSSKTIGAIDAGDAGRVFAHANPTVQRAMVADTSERWGADAAGQQPAGAAPWQGEPSLPSGPAAADGPRWDGGPGDNALTGDAALPSEPPPSPAYGADWSDRK